MATLGPRQRIDLIARIARHFQQTYTFAQIKQLLRQYDAYWRDPVVNSKFDYVEEQLGETNSQIVLRIGEDYGLIQPTIQPSAQSANRLWKDEGFRLFISHSAKVKSGVAELSKELRRFGIMGFVAHDSIEPGQEWQVQIELALQTMDALTFLVTKEVKSSNWCDQEVGWALGSGKLVVPIRTDADPYGFVGRYQGVNGLSRSKSDVAFDLACILASNEKTKGQAGGIAFALASRASREEESERFFKAISAIVDNGSIDSKFSLSPLAEKIKKKFLWRPGVTDAFVEYLKEKDLEELASAVQSAEVPF